MKRRVGVGLHTKKKSKQKKDFSNCAIAAGSQGKMVEI